jgi:hypothetical protein
LISKKKEAAMRWISHTEGFFVEHVTEEDAARLNSLAPQYSVTDCYAFLKNALSSTLFLEKISFEELLKSCANGVHGDIEGACNAYESRHFEGNLIFLGK